MHRIFVGIVLIFSFVPALAQIDSNTVTAVASRAPKIQPDQTAFIISISAPITATLSDVAALIRALGVTASNFDNVAQEYQPLSSSGVRLRWRFILNIPFSRLNEINATLTRLQASAAAQGFDIYFDGASPVASDQAVSAQACNATDLLTDAREQAQQIAAASGRVLGRLLALAGSTGDSCSITVKFSVVGF